MVNTKYSICESIPTIKTRSKDGLASVIAGIIIAYDLDDEKIALEFIERRFELRNFISGYFSSKDATELTSKKMKKIKKELIEQLNTNFLENKRARKIIFDKEITNIEKGN